MIRIRAAEERDSVDIFEWRNDALTRQMSHSRGAIDWPTHCEWLSASLANRNRILLICEHEDTNKKIGIVRFDINKEKALISISLSPEQRGRKLSKPCLTRAALYLINNFPDIKTIEAEVKVTNIASRKAFEGAEFRFVKEDVDFLLYEFSRTKGRNAG